MNNSQPLLGIDCRELTRSSVRSLGLILGGLVQYLSLRGNHLVLFSDVPLASKYLLDGCENISRGSVCGKGFDVARYQYWVKKEAEKRGVAAFYQGNQYTLFRIKECRMVSMIPDLYPLANIEPFGFGYKASYRLFIRRTLANSDKITVISNATREDIVKHFGRKSDLEVLYCGIHRPPERSDVPDRIVEGPYLLFLGRVSYWKGTLRLLELFEKGFLGSDYKLVIAGEAFDQETVDAVKSYEAQYPNIIYYGYASDEERESLYQHADLLCYPSRFDGFGLPPLEAAVRGTKCLMNDIPVLREVTKNQGYYVDYYGDDDQVISTIKEVLSDDDGKLKGLAAIAEGYRWPDYYKRIEELLKGE